MSRLVLGTVQFGLNYGINNQNGKPDFNQAKTIVDSSIKNSITNFDTAQGYGDAEQMLGKALENINSSVVVHSKFSLPDDFNEETILDLADKSLSTLGIKKLGYFYFHRFIDFQKFEEKKMTLDQRFYGQAEGLAVSVYDETEIALALESKQIKAIQLPLNIFDSSENKRLLLSQIKERNVEIHCRSVFLQGLFFMDPEKLPAKLQAFKPYLIELQRISKNSSLPIMTLALGFVKKIKEIDGVLIGVDTEAQLLENVAAWNTELPLSVLTELEKLKFPEKDLLMPKNWN
jgi:aryl-alcohol dehydrogenase-like predicted oxidoreductase